MSAAVTQTFHRFVDLPTELQIKIWSYAADKLDLTLRWLELILSLEPDPTGWAYGIWVHFQLFSVPSYFTQSNVMIMALRSNLMWTCRLAKQIALEKWREDIAEIVVTIMEPPFEFLNERKEETKRDVLNLVDMFIRATKEAVLPWDGAAA